MRKALALLACLAFCPAATATGNRTGGAPCQPNLANQLASTGSAKQLVTVIAERRTSTQAAVQIWEPSGECWTVRAGLGEARLGRRGVSENRHEGDRTTPAGAYGFGRVMFGVGPNPGVRYRYHRIVCGDWWVEDPSSPYYNRFRHVRCGAPPPFRITSEDMSRSPTAYRHFAVIRFNMDPIVPGRGSGIFLHASTGRPTQGCVSLPLPQLLTLLRWLRPGSSPLIVIGTRATIRRY
jgi:L,D-peptidoglycan transpeptidase YkuD (ErfK/YbiS/YcfS/YnhG family)